MSSGIGNRRIMRALGKVLGIEDVKQAPARLKTDELVPVVGLDPGMAGYQTWQTFGAGLSLAGISSAAWPIVGNVSGAAIFDPFRQLENGDKEFAVLGLRVVITFTDAGAVADEGQTPFVSYWRQQTAAGAQAPESYIEMGMIEPVGGPSYFIHSIPMQLRKHRYEVGDPGPATVPTLNIRPLWVPAGSFFGLTVAKTSGSNFPAGTTVDVAAWGVHCPQGMRPPGI